MEDLYCLIFGFWVRLICGFYDDFVVYRWFYIEVYFKFYYLIREIFLIKYLIFLCL